MKKGKRIINKIKSFVFSVFMVSLALLVMPVNAYADVHHLNFSAHPGGCASISPINGWVNVSSETGAQTSFSCAPVGGYAFYKWIGIWPGDPDRVSYSQSTTMACSGLTEAHAYLVKNSQTGIVAKSADEEMGTAIGTRPWSWSVDGQYFTISATPKDPTKYEFDYWDLEGSRLDIGATAEVKMPGISGYDTSSCNVDSSSQDIYTAHFKSKGADHGFRAIVDSVEGGNISSGSFIPYSTWSSSGSATATAIPSAGYEFDYWLAPDGTQIPGNDRDNEINIGYPGDASVDKSKDVTYTAKFKKKEAKGITSKTVGGGVVSPSYVEWTTANANQAITFTASPDKGKEFKEWTIPSELDPDGTLDKLNPTISLVMPAAKPDSDLTITATFQDDTKFEVYTESAAIQGGLIVRGHGGTVNPAMVNPDTSATEYTLVAEPHDGFEFDSWEIVDAGGSPGVSFVTDSKKSKVTISVPKASDMTEDAHIRAVFKYALDDGIRGIALEGGSVSPKYVKWSEQTRDTSINMTATADPGYEFDHWIYYNGQAGVKDEEYSKSATISVIMPAEQMTEDIIYTAVFKKNSEKEKNKQIHVHGKKTGITDESFLNKWKKWIDPAISYVRSTIKSIAGKRVAEDKAVYDSNKASGYSSNKAAEELKATIESGDKLKHSQSVDNPIVPVTEGFGVSEVSGIGTVFENKATGDLDVDEKEAVASKYGNLYKYEVVLSGDIYFNNEDGSRITREMADADSDATVIISGMDTEDTDIWMLLYKDLSNKDFTITPVADSSSTIRFTLPDRCGGKITLISVKYSKN